MHIFSSMPHSDILVDNTSSRGVQALHDFLYYAETGRITGSGSIIDRFPDSDFKIAVMHALAKYGYTCEPQVGVSGFRLDIAVRNPNYGCEGQFLMGIECDGATYHSSKSARDRDRLRQEILENLGWEIYRIWSTDWFKNQHAALMPILNRLEELKKRYPAKVAKSETTLASIEQSGPVIMKEPIKELQSDDTPKGLLNAIAKDMAIAYPDIPDKQRLLRPAMIEALLHHSPRNREEFLQRIPLYLRENISAEQGIYLPQIFSIFE